MATDKKAPVIVRKKQPAQNSLPVQSPPKKRLTDKELMDKFFKTHFYVGGKIPD